MVVLELLAVALAVICVVLYTTWEGGIISLIGAALSIALYIAIRWKDSKNSRLSVEKESMCNVYQKELAYLAKELAETRVRTKAEIEQRREAICELAAKEPLRTAFLAATHGKHVNTSDVLNGSRLFLQSVTSLPITGIIATHDLELSKMQQEHPDRFHNYCFEIQLSDEITYTYRLSEGVARNQNATYLLKNILKKAFIRT